MENNPDQLSPGDIVRFDFELATDNTVISGEAVSSIKRTIWADDRYDYQGSEEKDENGKRMLFVYASVRKTRRQQRGEIQYTNLSTLEASVKAAAMVWGENLTWIKTTVTRFEQGIEAAATAGVAAVTAGAKALPAMGTAVLLVAAVVFYAYFFGGSKRVN